MNIENALAHIDDLIAALTSETYNRLDRIFLELLTSRAALSLDGAAG